MLLRRDFLTGLATTAGCLTLGQQAVAQLSLGQASLTTVSDGNLVLPSSFAFDGKPTGDVENLISQYSLGQQTLEPECNLALYQDGTNTVLFDVGAGADFMPTAGNITDSLATLGLSPEDITHVLFTHAHPDHIWGLLDDFDDPMFTQAQYFMGRKEWDYWWNPETVNTIDENRTVFAVGAKRRMEAIEGAVTFIDDGDEVLAGISAIETFGHTPGHMAFDIQDKALIVGDAIGNHHMAFHHPDWASGSDQIADQGIIARSMLLDRLVSEQKTVVGFHLPNGGMGRVERADGAYRFISEV